MSEQVSRGTSVVKPGDGSFDAFFDLWFVPLWDFATLLLGSRAAGEEAVLDAMLDARAVWDRLGGEHQPIAYARERVVRARPARAVEIDDDHGTLWRVLDAIDHEDRASLIAVVHERVPDVEAARLIGCPVDEVRAHTDRAVEEARDVLAGEQPDAASFPEAWLRVAMQHAAADRPLMMDPVERLDLRSQQRRRARAARWTGIGGLVVFVAGVAAFAGILSGGSSPARDGGEQTDVFTEERLGYELTIADGWRAQATLADPRGDGTFDPSRFGLSSVEPSDETAAFIPDNVEGASALLTITVSPTRSHLDDVGRLRDQLAQQQRTSGTVVTAALVSIVDRPATRFRVEHPDDSPTCAGCRSMLWSVLWFHGATMTIEFSAFSEEAFNRLAPDAEAMIRSITPVNGERTLRYTPVSGTLRGGIEYDPALEAVLQFMDARVRGSDAEAWLSEEAGESFRFDDRLGLYTPGTGGTYAHYAVIGRSVAPDGSPSFEVDVVVTAKPGGDAVGALRERLVVGPARNALGQEWPEAIISVQRADR